jgi:large subunit ribosomal protein L25
MAEAVVLTTQPRTGRGSKAARRLRAEGRVPAIVYGHKEEPAQITLVLEDLEKAVKSGTHLVELDAGGKRQTALIRELQFDYLGKDLLHADFYRVSKDERVKVPVKLELRGIAPGATGGGVLDQPMHTLMVECPVVNVPNSIRVNIEKLQVGHAIHVKELQLPEGVKALADGDAVVVIVKMPGAEPEPGAIPGAGAAEPEVITARKEKEEAAE